MADNKFDNNTQPKKGQPARDETQQKTPRETPYDIDETTARDDEYNAFNKNTVNPKPQTTPGK